MSEAGSNIEWGAADGTNLSTADETMKRARLRQRVGDTLERDRNKIAWQAEGDEALIAQLGSMVAGDWTDMVMEIRRMTPAERKGELARLDRAFEATHDGKVAMKILMAKAMAYNENDES